MPKNPRTQRQKNRRKILRHPEQLRELQNELGELYNLYLAGSDSALEVSTKLYVIGQMIQLVIEAYENELLPKI